MSRPIAQRWGRPCSAGNEGVQTTVASLLLLMSLGSRAACAGGASVLKAAAQVTFSGALAKALTAGGELFFG